MSTTEETNLTESKKPARKAKKPARSRAPAAAAAPPTPPAEFAGITTTECCDGCGPDKCVISGINVCAHPFKAGLQSAQLQQHDVVKRYNRAKAALKDQIIDLRSR